ncbi:hypothetical protein FHU33_4092 [Blastococcus colisei]|uniref:Uncharacterized protein n=1 Tax=Blastococcus colisei TaxID=1564162 RepID=A0A543P0E2_9ACTN|nr:hypothetical protein FHU33_4092 [Blastococcus colisei]
MDPSPAGRPARQLLCCTDVAAAVPRVRSLCGDGDGGARAVRPIELSSEWEAPLRAGYRPASPCPASPQCGPGGHPPASDGPGGQPADSWDTSAGSLGRTGVPAAHRSSSIVATSPRMSSGTAARSTSTDSSAALQVFRTQSRRSASKRPGIQCATTMFRGQPTAGVLLGIPCRHAEQTCTGPRRCPRQHHLFTHVDAERGGALKVRGSARNGDLQLGHELGKLTVVAADHIAHLEPLEHHRLRRPVGRSDALVVDNVVTETPQITENIARHVIQLDTAQPGQMRTVHVVPAMECRDNPLLRQCHRCWPVRVGGRLQFGTPNPQVMSRRPLRIGRTSTDEDSGVGVLRRPTMLRGLVGEMLEAGDCELGRNVGLSKFSDDSAVVIPRRITTHASRVT